MCSFCQFTESSNRRCPAKVKDYFDNDRGINLLELVVHKVSVKAEEPFLSVKLGIPSPSSFSRDFAIEDMWVS